MNIKTEKVIKCMVAMQRHPWEQGVCAQAVYEAGREDLWIPMACDAVKRQAEDGRLAMVGGGAAVSDPAANGEVCLRAWEVTKDPFFLEGARGMLSYLENTAPRTGDGIICHNNATFHEGYSPRQLWIDGLYMVPPFLAVMGKTEEAAKQIRGYIRHLFDEEAGLFFHIRDVEGGCFVRAKHWATGNGWAVMGLCRVIEEADRAGREDLKNEFSPFLNRVLGAMLALQSPDGRFHDILDEPDSFMDGTSGLMLAAAVFRGICHGYVPASLAAPAEKAMEAAAERIDGMGLLHEVCGCPHFLTQGTSAEAQAAFVMAQAWRDRFRARG